MDINLIPDRVLYRKKLFFSRLGKTLGVAVLAVGLIALMLVKPYQHWKLQKHVEEVAASLEVPEVKEIGDLENKLADIKREYSELEAMVGEIPSRDIKPTDILRRISSHMPSSIQASDILFQPEIRQLTLTLTATRRQDIPLLLRRLHDDPLLEDINISEISGAENQCSFSVMLKLR